MTTILITFILAFLISLITTFCEIPLAKRWGITDKPDSFRKLHQSPVPLLGGIAVFIGFIVPLIALMILKEQTLVANTLELHSDTILKILACAGLTLILGLIDDLFGLKARWKLLWQILIALLAFKLGFRIETISNPFSGSFSLGVFACPVTIFWFVACMNAVNLLDGMDGLASGVCLFVCITIFSMSLMANNSLGMLMMACLSGSIVGFLMFNFPPARIFLGDSGSLTLGFLVGALSLVGAHHKAETAVALFVPVVALGLPIIDTSLAMIRRWYHKLPLSSPDHRHIHHMLTSMGYSPRRAVLTLYAFCVFFGLASLLMMTNRDEIVLLVMLMIGTLVYVCLRLFSGMTFRDIMMRISEATTQKQQTTSARVEAHQTISRMKRAEDIRESWKLCTEVFEVLQLETVEMDLTCREDCPEDCPEYKWKNDTDKETDYVISDSTNINMSLSKNDIKLGTMDINVDAGNLAVRLSPYTLEILDQLRTALSKKVSECIRESDTEKKTENNE